MMKAVREKIPPNFNFFDKLICTFQRRLIGRVMTVTRLSTFSLRDREMFS